MAKSLYIMPAIFSILLLYAGVFCSKFPVKYGKEDVGRRPVYKSKLALENAKNWNLAQKTFGRWCLLFATVNVVIGTLTPRIFYYFTNFYWTREDATLPFFLIILLPGICEVLLARIFTEIKVRNFLTRGQKNV